MPYAVTVADNSGDNTEWNYYLIEARDRVREERKASGEKKK